MIKVVGIGGVPASGKTELMNMLRSEFGYMRRKQEGLLHYEHYYEEPQIVVLGRYGIDLGTFEGTDRLSMAVSPVAFNFIESLSKTQGGVTVVFEGDRLFNQSFLSKVSALKNVRTGWYVLQTNESENAQRQKQRGNLQTQAFLKGRNTKYKNIINSVPGVFVMQNNTRDDGMMNHTTIMGFINA